MRKHNYVGRLAMCGLALSLAMIFSYVEAIIPSPVPGIKLGLANVVCTYVFFRIGKTEAFYISVLRVVLSSVLFGSAATFVFSLFGALLAFSAMMLCTLMGNKVSFIGISVLSAAAHCTGQIIAAVTVYSSLGIIRYLPVLLLCSVPLGIVTGTVVTVTDKRFGGNNA